MNHPELLHRIAQDMHRSKIDAADRHRLSFADGIGHVAYLLVFAIVGLAVATRTFQRRLSE